MSAPVRGLDEFGARPVGVLDEKHSYSVNFEGSLLGLISGGGDPPMGVIEVGDRQRDVLVADDGV